MKLCFIQNKEYLIFLIENIFVLLHSIFNLILSKLLSDEQKIVLHHQTKGAYFLRPKRFFFMAKQQSSSTLILPIRALRDVWRTYNGIFHVKQITIHTYPSLYTRRISSTLKTRSIRFADINIKQFTLNELCYQRLLPGICEKYIQLLSCTTTGRGSVTTLLPVHIRPDAFFTTTCKPKCADHLCQYLTQ